MMPQPVKPATKTEATRPRLLGKRAEMWNCARWKVMLPKPSRIAAGMKALTPEEEDTPNSTNADILSSTPAHSRGSAWAELAGSDERHTNGQVRRQQQERMQRCTVEQQGGRPWRA